ncbi:MAG: hypothetical protein M3Q99_10540 [Acidobacteriota bacterium]|nr:hypothetical protein [Acidobacteriota bacterium]
MKQGAFAPGAVYRRVFFRQIHSKKISVTNICPKPAEVKTAIMCSESQPLTKHKIARANCHRVGMLAPLLRAKGASKIIHILPNGDSTEFDESIIPSIW